jgi:hypothetical protein
MNHRLILTLALATAAACAAGPAASQPRQVVKPPQAQAWIDVATFSGMGMPMGGAGANPMAAIGSLFGGGAAATQKVSFGMTQAGGAGRFVDVSLMSRQNPALSEATQQVPPGFMSPALKLVAPGTAPAERVPDNDDDVVVPERDPQRPEGKLYLYWGCGDTVRAGQPRVVDFASATPADLAQVFQSRRATQRGAHTGPGRPSWPNATDGRAVPAAASLAGDHAFSGAGVPEGFKFALPAAQDLMPALQLQQADQGGAVALSWAALPTARAYFVAGMGSRGKNEMVLWTSSELPDAGFGLIDYQTNPAVDRWLREKVLLAPGTTRCSVPKGVFSGEGAMLRAIAYGNEYHVAYPPRPTDVKLAWEPVWAVKVRLKSVASAIVGMPSMEQASGNEAAADQPAAKPADDKTKMPSAFDILRGVIGK